MTSKAARIATLLDSLDAAGWLNTADGTTIQDVLNTNLPAVKDIQTVDGGVIDAAPLLKLADALGPFSLGKGRYLVKTALTLDNFVNFSAGARIILADNDLVLAGGMTAGFEQVFEFQGTGKVLGLRTCQQVWFDGDIAVPVGADYPATICDGPVQRALDATQGGTVYGDAGVRLKGPAFFDLGSANYEGNGCLYLWTSSVTNGFAAGALAQNKFLRGFDFAPATSGTIPTSGTAVLSYAPNHKISNFRILDAYSAISYEIGSLCSVVEGTISGSLQFGFRNKITDLFVDNMVIDAGADWIDLTGITGSFEVDDLVIIDGGSGIVRAKYPGFPNRRRIQFYDGMPVAGGNIQSNHGGSATMSAVTIGHQSGGVRIEGNAEAFTTGYIECFGGMYSLVTVSASGTPGRAGNFAFSRLSDRTFFDSSYLGSILEGAYGCKVLAWFGYTRSQSAPGLAMRLCQRVKVESQIVANSGCGLAIDGNTCSHIEVNGVDFDGNCRNYNGEANMAEIIISGTLQYLSIDCGRAGFLGLNGVQPPLALWLDAAASDYIKVSVTFQAPAGAIHNGSTGTHNAGL